MSTLARKVMIAAVLAGAAIPVVVEALVVFDPSNWAENVAQVSGQVTEIANQASALANQVSQINNQLQQLQRLASGDFSAIVGLAAEQNADLANLLTTAATLQYSLNTVQAQINAAFPQGAVQWGSYNMANLGAQRQQWDALITEAGSTAARAQTSLNRIQDRNQTLANLMTASDGAGGDVRQAQIGNQINGTLAQSMNDLIAVQTTTNRMATVQAQTAVAEREVAREQARRSLVNFTDMGPVVVPLNTFPNVQ